MFVQLTAGTAEPPKVWEARAGAGNRPGDADRPHLVRFRIDGLPVSVVVRDQVPARPSAGRSGENREPFLSTACLSRTDARSLTLHLANRSLHASLEAIREELGSGDIVAAPPAMENDPIVQSLGRALLAHHQLGQDLSTLYTHAVCAALVARIVVLCRVARESGDLAHDASGNRGGLPKWRLRRVEAYVDANLSRRVRLADMAASAGLSRMHFATQFRLATGLPPHEYLLRCRIERAQERLRDPAASLIETALDVGFQTQSHFTTVFKRFAGITPDRWRRLAAMRDRHRTIVGAPSRAPHTAHGAGRGTIVGASASLQ